MCFFAEEVYLHELMTGSDIELPEVETPLRVRCNECITCTFIMLGLLELICCTNILITSKIFLQIVLSFNIFIF